MKSGMLYFSLILYCCTYFFSVRATPYFALHTKIFLECTYITLFQTEINASCITFCWISDSFSWSEKNIPIQLGMHHFCKFSPWIIGCVPISKCFDRNRNDSKLCAISLIKNTEWKRSKNWSKSLLKHTATLIKIHQKIPHNSRGK